MNYIPNIRLQIGHKFLLNAASCHNIHSVTLWESACIDIAEKSNNLTHSGNLLILQGISLTLAQSNYQHKEEILVWSIDEIEKFMWA